MVYLMILFSVFMRIEMKKYGLVLATVVSMFMTGLQTDFFIFQLGLVKGDFVSNCNFDRKFYEWIGMIHAQNHCGEVLAKCGYCDIEPGLKRHYPAGFAIAELSIRKCAYEPKTRT